VIDAQNPLVEIILVHHMINKIIGTIESRLQGTVLQARINKHIGQFLSSKTGILWRFDLSLSTKAYIDIIFYFLSTKVYKIG
jgi:hypothetical protein